MSILRSQRELTVAASAEIGNKGGDWSMVAIAWEARTPCFICKKMIGIDERPFRSSTAKHLTAHQGCLVKWLPDVLVDVERIIREGGNAAAGSGAPAGVQASRRMRLIYSDYKEKFNLKRIFALADAAEASE